MEEDGEGGGPASAELLPRGEAVKRMTAVIDGEPTLGAFLGALEEVAALSGLPPHRCVWFGRLWGYASRRWKFPELLAALRAVEGAEVAPLVRMVGKNGSIHAAAGVYKEACASGWCDEDGGAAATAMAWAYDGAGRSHAKAADALWDRLHALAMGGRLDVAAVRKSGGGREGNANRGRLGFRRGWGLPLEDVNVEPEADERGRGDPSSTSAAAGAHRRPSSIAEQRAEVFHQEIASKARRRHRAAADAYARFRDGDHARGWAGRRGRSESSREPTRLRLRFPRATYTAACRSASALRDARFARRIALDMVTDGVAPDSYAVASLVPVIGRAGTADAARDAEAVFLRARDAGVPLGGAAWSCTIGAMCRGSRLDRARGLLDEMEGEPFMRTWPSCPTQASLDEDDAGADPGGGGDDEDTRDTTGGQRRDIRLASLWAADATDARKAAAERRAAAPAYAQMMHALCEAGRAGEALDVHRRAGAAGIYVPGNPRHYRALYKALTLAGGEGGIGMAPRRAAAAAVADAVRAAMSLSSAAASSSPLAEHEAAPLTASASLAHLGTSLDSTTASEAMRAALHVAAAGGFPDIAAEARSRLRTAGVSAHPDDLELTLEAYARGGDAAGAAAHWKANRRALLAGGEAGGGDVDGADDVLGCEPTPRAWTAGIKAHCEAGEVIAAAALLEEAVEAAAAGDDRRARARGAGSPGTKSSDRNKRFAVERIAFNLVAAAFSRDGSPGRAEKVLRLMEKADVPPDETTYNTVIGAYAAAARPPRGGDRGWRWRQRQEEIGGVAGVTGGSGGVSVFGDVPSGARHHSAASADLDEDIAAADGFAPPTPPSFLSPSASQDETEDDEDPVDAACRLLAEMRSAGSHLRPSVRSWTAVLSACAAAGDAARATEMFERMRASKTRADVRAWTALMNAHAARGDLSATAATYWRMREAGVMPDEATLAAALTAGRRGGGDASTVIAIYRDMRSLDVRPNNAGFRELTEMWVDQAFKAAGGGGAEVPNFMLADVLGSNPDEGDVDAFYGDSESVGREGLSGSPLVDVHGLSTVETRAAVLSVLQALRERRRAGLPVSGDLVIVTGLGRHSEGEPMLRDAVERLARDLQLDVAAVERNPGRLVVKKDALLAWLDRGAKNAESASPPGRSTPRPGPGGSVSEASAPERTLVQGRHGRRRVRRLAGGAAARRAAAAGQAGGGGARGEERDDVPGLDVALRDWLRENDDGR